MGGLRLADWLRCDQRKLVVHLAILSIGLQGLIRLSYRA
jgi:hypothetical protein